MKTKHPIFVQNDRIYVSLRDICDNLKIPIEWNEEQKEAIVEINQKKTPVSEKTISKEEGAIPDEITAMAIGKILLEKYAGKPLEYETSDKIFYLEVF